jgi:hypothetical protein
VRARAAGGGCRQSPNKSSSSVVYHAGCYIFVVDKIMHLLVGGVASFPRARNFIDQKVRYFIQDKDIQAAIQTFRHSHVAP